MFKDTEISPRWIAANKNNVEVTVAYRPSSKRVSYHFQHLPAQNLIKLKVSGDPESYFVRILLPTGKKGTSAKIDGKPVTVQNEKIEKSMYAVFPAIQTGSHEIEVRVQ